METTSIYEVLLALVAIFGSLGTAIATFVSVRNQIKQANTESLKSDKLLPVEVAERVSAMSLRAAERLENDLTDCRERAGTLETRLDSILAEASDNKLRVKSLLLQLKTLLEKHDELCEECMNKEEVNRMIQKIISELED